VPKHVERDYCSSGLLRTRCIIAQKSAAIIYFAAGAWNRAFPPYFSHFFIILIFLFVSLFYSLCTCFSSLYCLFLFVSFILYFICLFLCLFFMFFLSLLILFRCSFFLFLSQFFLPFLFLSCGTFLLFLPFGAVDLFLLFHLFDAFLLNMPLLLQTTQHRLMLCSHVPFQLHSVFTVNQDHLRVPDIVAPQFWTPNKGLFQCISDQSCTAPCGRLLDSRTDRAGSWWFPLSQIHALPAVGDGQGSVSVLPRPH